MHDILDWDRDSLSSTHEMPEIRGARSGEAASAARKPDDPTEEGRSRPNDIAKRETAYEQEQWNANYDWKGGEEVQQPLQQRSLAPYYKIRIHAGDDYPGDELAQEEAATAFVDK